MMTDFGSAKIRLREERSGSGTTKRSKIVAVWTASLNARRDGRDGRQSSVIKNYHP